jgi:F0F1-type ATP synthase assembly protein I
MSTSADHEPDGAPELPGWAAFAVMGTTVALCVALGVIAGVWCDNAFHVAPAGLLVGIVLGVAVAVVSVIQQIRRYL